MSSIPLAANNLRVPEQPNALEQYARIMQIKGQQQNQQIQGQEIQKNQLGIDQTKAVNDAYHGALTTDANGKISIDQGKLTDALSRSNHGAAIPGILENINKYQKSQADLEEIQGKTQQAARDSLGFLGSAIQQSKYDPHLADVLIEQRLRTPGVPPQEQQQLQGIRKQIQQNPQVLQQIADNLVAQSPKVRETGAAEMTANARRITAENTVGKNGPMAPPEIAMRNQQFAQRFQVLNPGKPLPPELTLQPGAKRQDWEDLDKSLEQIEKAQGVKAQQSTANAMREQSQNLAAQNAADRKEEKGMTPVVGNDAQGNRMLVSRSDAEKMGLTGVTKADADLQNKSEAARHWLKLANKVAPDGSSPDQMGIMQLVDKMDKEGKLGPLVGRWNEFLAGKVGAGDPEVAALRAKMGLSTTKLMQAHVGSRGGAFMMEHFEDLANQKKMDGPTLKQALGSELDYMKDVAMLPPDKNPGGTPKSGKISVTAPDGSVHPFDTQAQADAFKKLAHIQ